jgi:rhamnosyltransferase
MDSFFRCRNYPERSRVKTKEDIPELGLLTAFCSDSLAAWDLSKIMAAGGFPETEFGEDMLLGAALILRGEKIVYCAESRCFHGHNDNLKELFRRGTAIGRMHSRHPELRRNFGSAGKYAAKQLTPGKMLRFFLLF